MQDCSLLEMYVPSMVSNGGICFICYVCNTCINHLNLNAPPFGAISETEYNRATYLRCTVPWDEQITRSQCVGDDDQQQHDGQ